MVGPPINAISGQSRSSWDDEEDPPDYSVALQLNPYSNLAHPHEQVNPASQDECHCINATPHLPTGTSDTTVSSRSAPPPSYRELYPCHRALCPCQQRTPIKCLQASIPNWGDFPHLRAVFDSHQTFTFRRDLRIYDGTTPILETPLRGDFRVQDLSGNIIVRVQSGFVVSRRIKLGTIDYYRRNFTLNVFSPILLTAVFVEDDRNFGFSFKFKDKTYGTVKQELNNGFVLSFPPSVQDVALKAAVLVATRCVINSTWKQGIGKMNQVTELKNNTSQVEHQILMLALILYMSLIAALLVVTSKSAWLVVGVLLVIVVMCCILRAMCLCSRGRTDKAPPPPNGLEERLVPIEPYTYC